METVKPGRSPISAVLDHGDANLAASRRLSLIACPGASATFAADKLRGLGDFLSMPVFLFALDIGHLPERLGAQSERGDVRQRSDTEARSTA